MFILVVIVTGIAMEGTEPPPPKKKITQLLKIVHFGFQIKICGEGHSPFSDASLNGEGPFQTLPLAERGPPTSHPIHQVPPHSLHSDPGYAIGDSFNLSLQTVYVNCALK